MRRNRREETRGWRPRGSTPALDPWSLAALLLTARREGEPARGAEATAVIERIAELIDDQAQAPSTQATVHGSESGESSREELLPTELRLHAATRGRIILS